MLLTPQARYILAAARLTALGDPERWTPEEFGDVAAMVTPPIGFAEWEARAAEVQRQAGVAAAPVAPPPEDNADTTATMAAILGGKANHLIRDGVMSIQEIPGEE